MDILLIMLKSMPSLIITTIIQYRLSSKVLGKKYPLIPTFFAMFLVLFLSGWLNLSFHIANDIGTNAFYYGSITLLFYICFFNSNLIKKLFLTVLITCGSPLIFYIFLPFANCFFGKSPDTLQFSLVIFDFASLFLCALCMEYIGKKFQNLQRELPSDYTIYLTVIIIFVYIAIYTAHERFLIINNGIFSIPTAVFFSLFAIAGILIVVIAIFAVDRQVNISLTEQLQAMQLESFQSRELEYSKFSGFRHDINNHLICLEGLLRNKKIEQATLYMEKLTNTITQFSIPVQTGNDYADALLSVKYYQATSLNIDISLDMQVPSSGFIEDIDLCSILSNAFDNAINACSLLKENERWIRARCFIKQEQLVIEVTNSKPDHIQVIDGKVFPKEIRANHGIGLDNVKSIVDKYSGILDLSSKDAFTFSVLLPKNSLQ